MQDGDDELAELVRRLKEYRLPEDNKERDPQEPDRKGREAVIELLSLARDLIDHLTVTVVAPVDGDTPTIVIRSEASVGLDDHIAALRRLDANAVDPTLRPVLPRKRIDLSVREERRRREVLEALGVYRNYRALSASEAIQNAATKLGINQTELVGWLKNFPRRGKGKPRKKKVGPV